MKTIFKQSVVSATYSDQNKYRKAVLLLTLYYTVGVVVILAIFNIMVYGLFIGSIQNQEHELREGRVVEEDSLEELSEERIGQLQQNLVDILLLSDAIIFVVSLGLAYVVSRKTLAPLEESYQQQARFVADAAHELRTPLSVVKAGSEVMLRSERSSSEYVEFIRESLEEIEHLITLSNNLLYLAERKKRDSMIEQSIVFSDLCKKQITFMSSYAKERMITIQSSIEENVILRGDKDALARMIVNLMKNAIDYTNAHGVVTITLLQKNSKSILSISDTGIGISAKDLPYIFERFYKVDHSRSRHSTNAGLGLAIVKEIVVAHKGEIKVESKMGKGTTFTVILPDMR